MIGATPALAAAGLSLPAYTAGSAVTLAVAGSVAFGAWRLRRALLPGWSGAPARLVEVVLALAATLAAAQVLGTFGALRRGWALLALPCAGLALAGLGVAARRIGQPADAPPAAPVTTREEIVAAVVGVAIVVAEWGAQTADALLRGMTHPDTLWYHGPFTARFLQEGSFSHVADLGYESARSYPFDSEVLHALAVMPFDRDLLSPLLNLGWLALAGLAAWCLGRRRGVGAQCVLGAMLALSLPILSGTQPGQASNDASPAILLLAAAALLVEGELAVVPTAVAGLAAGLAIGTKLIVAAPLVVVTVGVAFLARRQRRPVAFAAWCAGLLFCGGYWFVRNWVTLDNPLPWFGVELGPLSLPRRIDEGDSALVAHLTDGYWWRVWYLPSFRQALGRAWPVMPVLPFVGAVAALVRRRRPAPERLFGLTVLASFVAYVFTPLGGGLAVWSNVRYLAPVLLLGFAFFPLVVADAPLRWRRASWAALLGLVAVNATTTFKPAMSPWPKSHAHALPGLALGGAVLAAAWLLMRAARPDRPPLPQVGLSRRAAVVALAGLVAAGAWSGGFWVQRRYLDGRYVDAGLPLDALNASFRDVRDARVAVIGTVETYPMFGLDLSNRVSQIVAPGDAATGRALCDRWEAILAGRFDYVVLTRYGLVYTSSPPEEWFASDPSATEVLREGETVVYRVDGPLHPQECL